MDSEFDAALRSDMRLGSLHGQGLIRQEGQHLLELVEEVRGLARTDGDAAAKRVGANDAYQLTEVARLAGLPVSTAHRLAIEPEWACRSVPARGSSASAPSCGRSPTKPPRRCPTCMSVRAPGHGGPRGRGRPDGGTARCVAGREVCSWRTGRESGAYRWPSGVRHHAMAMGRALLGFGRLMMWWSSLHEALRPVHVRA
jgi:hypothetical protein